MNIVITLTEAGTDTGPFNIYSNVDGYLSPFETNISKADLLVGFPTINAPEGTVEIRIKSVNALCNNSTPVGVVPLEYYFSPRNTSYIVDYKEDGASTYLYGYFDGYFNGSYIVPGNLIVKLNQDLTVDTSFNVLEGFNYSIVYIGATIYKQLDSKIILSGFYSSFNEVSANKIIRLNTDGTRDNTFNVGSGFNGYTTKISADSNKNLFITGIYTSYNNSPSPRIIKLLPDGSKDTSFNPGTGFNSTSIDILMNPDNTFYVTGYFTTYNGNSAPKIIKIKPDASVDTTFNPGTGFNVNNLTVNLARIVGEDSFYAGGYFTTYNGLTHNHIVKIKPDGTVDETFNSGVGFNGDVGVIRVLWGNKIYCPTGANGTYGPFTSYNNTPTNGSPIILNADGSILKTWNITYGYVFVVGNNVYGQPDGGELQIIYQYTP